MAQTGSGGGREEREETGERREETGEGGRERRREGGEDELGPGQTQTCIIN